jgi:hypothetical protein
VPGVVVCWNGGSRAAKLLPVQWMLFKNFCKHSTPTGTAMSKTIRFNAFEMNCVARAARPVDPPA